MPQAEGQSRGLTYLHLGSPAPGTLDPGHCHAAHVCVCACVPELYIVEFWGNQIAGRPVRDRLSAEEKQNAVPRPSFGFSSPGSFRQRLRSGS